MQWVFVQQEELEDVCFLYSLFLFDRLLKDPYNELSLLTEWDGMKQFSNLFINSLKGIANT